MVFGIYSPPYEYLVLMTVTEEFFGEEETLTLTTLTHISRLVRFFFCLIHEIGAVYIPRLKKRGIKKKSGVE